MEKIYLVCGEKNECFFRGTMSEFRDCIEENFKVLKESGCSYELELKIIKMIDNSIFDFEWLLKKDPKYFRENNNFHYTII